MYVYRICLYYLLNKLNNEDAINLFLDGSVDHDVDDYDSDDDRHPTSRDSLPRNGDIITSRRPTDDEHADGECCQIIK